MGRSAAAAFVAPTALAALGAFGGAALGGAALAATSADATASITLIPATVGTGDELAVYGSGFCGEAGCSPVAVALDRATKVSGVKVDGAGRFNARFVVDVAPGPHEVAAVQSGPGGARIEARATLTVAAVDRPSSTTTTTRSPSTTTRPPPSSTTTSATTTMTTTTTSTTTATAPATSGRSRAGRGTPGAWLGVAAAAAALAAMGAVLARRRARRNRGP